MNDILSERTTIGPADLQVSPIGIGTNMWGSGRNAEPDLKPVFDAALQLGINFFDTAEVYSFGGSERTLGLFLQDANPKPVVASKFFPFPWRLNRSGLIHALKSSLRRLHLAQLDLYLIHFPWPPVPLETWIDGLAEAVESGLARYVGVSNFNADQMVRAHASLAKRGIPLVCNQVEYSLLKRGIERNGLLALCRELDVKLVAYRPLTSGLLAGSITAENRPPGWRGRMYSQRYIAAIQPVVSLLKEIGEMHNGKTPSHVALNWLLCKGALPIPGATKVRNVEANAGSFGWRLTDKEVDMLDMAEEKFTQKIS